jgi:hypothetical protein
MRQAIFEIGGFTMLKKHILIAMKDIKETATNIFFFPVGYVVMFVVMAVFWIYVLGGF